MPNEYSSRKSAFLVAVVAGIAAVLSFASYEYSIIAADQILEVGSSEARSNAEVQAHDLSALLGKHVEAAAKNLETIASARSIQAQDPSGAIVLLESGQKSTDDLTHAYTWLDKDGKLLWSTQFVNASQREQFQGSDFSYREYYTMPKETLKPYYSSLFETIDGAAILTISYPIIEKVPSESGAVDDASATIFKGVVVASIDVKSLGKYVQGQLSPSYKSSIGLMDRNGIILYSSSSPQNEGKNIFGPEIQSVVSADVKEPFNQFIRDSLNGETGSGDFSSQGRTSTIAYNPVRINGNDFALLYVVTPHELTGTSVGLLNQQRILNLITVVSIGAVAAGISASLLIRNKKLSKKIAAKTSELKFANESLAESNRQLQVANSKLEKTNNLLAQANEDLRLHDKLQQEFVNVAAHELRTPIQPLLGAAELMESQFNDSDEIKITRPEIELIVRNAKRLERLSSDILEISRIDSGMLKLNKETFSLAYIIADAVKDAKTQLNFDPNRLSITYRPDDIFVQADREKITEVITNLITNAIKFTERGTISITTSKDSTNGVVLVIVKDTGSGIDPEIMPKLFEKFVTKSEKGTGIGLYISRKIIEAHGGTISGENNLDGPGAIFKFTVPLSEEETLGKDNENTKPASQYAAANIQRDNGSIDDSSIF